MYTIKAEDELRHMADQLETISLRVRQIMERKNINLSIELNPRDLRSVAKRIEEGRKNEND